MRILLVDGHQSESSVLVGQLGDRGHEIVRCFPEDGHRLCIGVEHPENCPVESLGCDVALVVRDPTHALQLREMGAVCALRRHIPLLEACKDGASPFATWSDPAGTAIVEAVEEFDSGFRPSLVAAVESRLADLPVVRRSGRLPTIAVRRVGSSLQMSITLSPGFTRSEEESVVTWAVRALREADPHALTADVTVRRS